MAITKTAAVAMAALFALAPLSAAGNPAGAMIASDSLRLRSARSEEPRRRSPTQLNMRQPLPATFHPTWAEALGKDSLRLSGRRVADLEPQSVRDDALGRGSALRQAWVWDSGFIVTRLALDKGGVRSAAGFYDAHGRALGAWSSISAVIDGAARNASGNVIAITKSDGEAGPHRQALLLDRAGTARDSLEWPWAGVELSTGGRYAIPTGSHPEFSRPFQAFRLGPVPQALPLPVSAGEFAAAFLDRSRALLVTGVLATVYDLAAGRIALRDTLRGRDGRPCPYSGRDPDMARLGTGGRFLVHCRETGEGGEGGEDLLSLDPGNLRDTAYLGRGNIHSLLASDSLFAWVEEADCPQGTDAGPGPGTCAEAVLARPDLHILDRIPVDPDRIADLVHAPDGYWIGLDHPDAPVVHWVAPGKWERRFAGFRILDQRGGRLLVQDKGTGLITLYEDGMRR